MSSYGYVPYDSGGRVRSSRPDPAPPAEGGPESTAPPEDSAQPSGAVPQGAGAGRGRWDGPADRAEHTGMAGSAEQAGRLAGRGPSISDSYGILPQGPSTGMRAANPAAQPGPSQAALPPDGRHAAAQSGAARAAGAPSEPGGRHTASAASEPGGRHAAPRSSGRHAASQPDASYVGAPHQATGPAPRRTGGMIGSPQVPDTWPPHPRWTGAMRPPSQADGMRLPGLMR